MQDYQDLPDDPVNDASGVHINSEIPNRVFFLVATAVGGSSWERTGLIWYATLLDKKLRDYANAPDGANFTSSFPSFVELTCTHALELFGSDVQANSEKGLGGCGSSSTNTRVHK